ncbi:hypothetical protein CEXT_186151 [Caerostris extrusa]|uniref:Uncharacterized protein n=1 Tax=Caerostris extrusa TaxID=172846 RepID=A0AAV4TUB0_CAEEX|nr:hypothetical protein CEXT_186151 [Caerostris extrusa]
MDRQRVTPTALRGREDLKKQMSVGRGQEKKKRGGGIFCGGHLSSGDRRIFLGCVGTKFEETGPSDEMPDWFGTLAHSMFVSCLTDPVLPLHQSINISLSDHHPPLPPPPPDVSPRHSGPSGVTPSLMDRQWVTPLHSGGGGKH